MSVRVIAVSLLALVSSIVAQAEPTSEARDMSRRGRGRAVDEQGKPIEGVSAAMLVERESGLMPEQYSSAAVTAADGAFELTGVLGSGAALVVTADGHHRSALSFVAPGTDVIVDLTPGGSVAGTVRDADGRPCPGASIWTYFEAGDHWEPPVADEVGRFAFSLAFPHGYRIQATVGPTRPFVDEWCSRVRSRRKATRRISWWT